MSTPKKDIISLLRGAGAAYLIKVFNVVLLFLYHVSLAKLLTADDYGTYVYVFSVTGMLAIFSQLGLGRGALRFMSSYLESKEYVKFKGVLWSSHIIVLLSGFFFSFTTLLVIILSKDSISAAIFMGMAIMVWRIPLQGLITLRQQVARASRKISNAYLPEQILLPLIALVVLIVLYLFGKLTLSSALGGYLFAACVTLVVGWKLVRSNMPTEIARIKPEFQVKELLLVSLPMLFAACMQVVMRRTDIIMLGALASMDKVGVYNAAMKISQLSNFPLISVNAIATPMIASFFYKKKMDRLEEFVQKAAKWSVLISLPISVVSCILSLQLLGVFGDRFLDGNFGLILMVLGNFISAIAGSVGATLSMTGHQNCHAKILFGCAVLNIVMNAVFIPKFGVTGAALATCLTTVFLNVFMSVAVYKYLKLKAYYVPSLKSIFLLAVLVISYTVLSLVANVYVMTVLFLVTFAISVFKLLLDTDEQEYLLNRISFLTGR